MRRIAVVTAVLASRTALPAMAANAEPIRDYEQDPFSQGYTGIPEHPATEPGHSDKDRDAKARECTCEHGKDHHDAKPPQKA